MSRIDQQGVPPRTTGPTLVRSGEIVRKFDEAKKDYAFGDSGDAEMFAAEMADILDEWIVAYQTGREVE